MIVTIDFRLFSEPKSKKNQNVLFDNCCSRNNRMLQQQDWSRNVPGADTIILCEKKSKKLNKQKIDFRHLNFTKLSDVRMSYGPTLQVHTIAYKRFYSQIKIQHI